MLVFATGAFPFPPPPPPLFPVSERWWQQFLSHASCWDLAVLLDENCMVTR